MNLIWLILIFLSSIIILICNPSIYLTTISSATQNAITLSISLCGIYAFWLGIMQIVNDSGLLKRVSKLLNPILSLLFKNLDTETKEYVSLNITANILGLGNACTPSGIKAVEKLTQNQEKANKNTIMFIVLNTTSLEIIPTTIISLRASLGSMKADSILFPGLVATFASTLFGIVLVHICAKIFKN